jgi:pheromone shutdown protein TraB
MGSYNNVVERLCGPDSDPRLTEDTIRCIEHSHGTSVVLVGVVHDHPASVFRAAHAVETLTPSVVALELPPLAMSLFRAYARDKRVPPHLGGEMSAALQVSGDARTVGIDGPNLAYLRRLARDIWTERLSSEDRNTVVRDVVSSLGHALACRVGGFVGRVTQRPPRLYRHLEYDVTLLDTPERQAEDETNHVVQRQSLLQAIEVPTPIRRIDTAREATMVQTLRALSAEGDVVAIVGIEHLDELVHGLGDTRA